MKKIEMVDLQSQYQKIKKEIDLALLRAVEEAYYIKGPQVAQFEDHLSNYLGDPHVVSCANGTDALQIALMALDLEFGDEVIVPAFTYVATAEVIALLGLKPVMVDVEPDSFNIDMAKLEQVVNSRTKVIVPVHLFGQCADMRRVMEFAKKHELYVIEDTAQALGAQIEYKGNWKAAGTIGDIGTYSFFPTKNLGCFGDGGALSTNDSQLAEKIRMIASHGQRKKYIHEVVGVNSRLDTVQAAILNVKLRYLDSFIAHRQRVAEQYLQGLADLDSLIVPISKYGRHTFNQFTLRVKGGRRDELQSYLLTNNIASIVYYPIPLYKQSAFSDFVDVGFNLPVTEKLCQSVLSIPIDTEKQQDTIDYIIKIIRKF